VLYILNQSLSLPIYSRRLFDIMFLSSIMLFWSKGYVVKGAIHSNYALYFYRESS